MKPRNKTRLIDGSISSWRENNMFGFMFRCGNRPTINQIQSTALNIHQIHNSSPDSSCIVGGCPRNTLNPTSYQLAQTPIKIKPVQTQTTGMLWLSDNSTLQSEKHALACSKKRSEAKNQQNVNFVGLSTLRVIYHGKLVVKRAKDRC